MGELDDMINAIGAVCEIAGFMLERLLDNGFSREEAFTVCMEYVLGTLGVRRTE